jgi:catalase-peroxidase
MGMNDSQTVALIGGGHAFGKAHGACPTGPGPDPSQNPQNPYPGTCGTCPNIGKGNNTYTSGIEGVWTKNPTIWSNDYFLNLLNFNWKIGKGPGGALQWHQTDDSNLKIMMMTTDIALLHDPSYKKLVEHYASDLKSLENDFSNAWYVLTTRDMGPVTRCKGNSIPPPQPFQNPLPPIHSSYGLISFDLIAKRISSIFHTKNPACTPDVGPNGLIDYSALFVTLAWQCASTWRQTDYTGGCNGAQLRFAPQKNWPNNKGMSNIIEVLQQVKSRLSYPESLISISDMIVLAGQVALNSVFKTQVNFTGGRVDALDGGISDKLAPRTYYNNAIVASRDNMKVMGFSPHLWVALAGRPRSNVQQLLLGYSGSYFTQYPYEFSNKFFQILLTNQWQLNSNKTIVPEYKAIGKDIYVLSSDLALIWDDEFKAIVQQYASDEALFKSNFAEAWSLLMNADIRSSAVLNGSKRIDFYWATFFKAFIFLSFFNQVKI